MSSLCILLPFPPTSNNLFVNNRRTGGRFPSKRYEEWRQEAARAIVKQYPLPRFDEPVEVVISLGRPDKRRRDLANYEKGPIDRLVSMGILADDSLIHRLTIQWATDVRGCRIEIEPFRLETTTPLIAKAAT